ncbi:MAG: helix-turn-helix domain-containing protein, partial [Gammaproteobacteria bacterium]
KALIQAALQRTHGRRQEAAQLLGWGRNTLARKIKELNIEK